ncbi:hypothetical protein ECANGB1_1271 [Enterospora canceri]|uniref:Uncharacterized protein n=1 Tax=Enterospora canceri TaxID=1081671 RepID=A0A1Y1S6E2_9MICR|nr:hypothetical protein ECANGB1_1271 [Enterospora canceri]
MCMTDVLSIAIILRFFSDPVFIPTCLMLSIVGIGFSFCVNLMFNIILTTIIFRKMMATDNKSLKHVVKSR